MSLADDVTAEPDPADRLADDLRRTREKLERKQKDAAYDAALARIGELERQVALLTALEERKPQKPCELPKRKRGSDTAILVLSDWHIGETVDPKTVNSLNEFNLEIADRRVKRVFEKCLLLLEDARHLASIDELVVAILGDEISGDIHPELLESNELAALPATMVAADLLERGLKTLKQHAGVRRIRVVTARGGNHARNTHKPQHSTATAHSYEYNMYRHLARRFKGERVFDWQLGDAYHNMQEIEGRNFRFHHGDAIKFFGGSGGLSIPMNKSVAQWNKSRQAYYDIAGHFHSWTHNWNWLINGSLVGYNAFAVSIKADYQPPVQSFLIVDRERGVTRALPVFCD